MGNLTSSSINFVLLNQSINRYVPIPLLFFGGIGNILNLLIFTREIFRKNICVIYFLGSTIFDSVVIIVGLLPRLLTGFNIDSTQYSSILCKLRFFLTYLSGYAAAWFISLACLERYLSSSTNIQRRQMMTMRRTYFSMMIIILMGFIFFGEHFYCIDINQNLLGAPQSCYQLKQNTQCQIVDSLMQCIFEILTPALMMTIFGFLTLKNIHQKLRRINPIQRGNTSIRMVPMTIETNQSAQQQITISRNINQSTSTQVNRREKKRDAQLISMLLIQVGIFVITTFPISVYKIYSVLTIYQTKSNLHKSIDNTIFNICVISLFINNTITFYIYTLCGAIFRKELIKLFR